MILPIVAYGDPVLKKEAEEIDKDYPNLDQLIADMFETMYEASGVGLAATQIGKSIRLFVVDGSPFAEDEDEEEFDGYKARIIQHEYDHIEGVLFTDHLSVLKKRLLTKRLANISQGIVEVDYRMKFPNTKKGR